VVKKALDYVSDYQLESACKLVTWTSSKTYSKSYQLYDSQQSSAWSSDVTCICNGRSCTWWVPGEYAICRAPSRVTKM